MFRSETWYDVYTQEKLVSQDKNQYNDRNRYTYKNTVLAGGGAIANPIPPPAKAVFLLSNKFIMKDDKCTHNVLVREYPLQILGISKENNIALVFCKECEESFFIDYESRV